MADIIPNVVISMPSQLFTQARSFKAVSNGKIYIGEIDTDPTIISNQIQVYVQNEDNSLVPVSQPIIINAGGYPVYLGQISKFVTDKDHSMAVYDSYGAQQFYFSNILKYSPDQLRQELASPSTPGASLVETGSYGSVEDVINDIHDGEFDLGYRGYTVKDRLDEVISVMAIPGVKGDGVTDDQPAIQAYINANSPREIFFPSGHDYFFGSTLTISSVSTYVHGSKGYPGGSRIICGTPNMSAILSTNYGARFEDLAIVGPASERLDDSIAFGQLTTCTGISFLRGDGSKDIDSDVSRVAFQHLKKGIYGKGCNLKATGCLFTSVLQPHYYEQLDSATEIRGMIITECRYHHLGGGGASLAVTYPELLTSSCVTILGVFSRGNVITDNYADAQIRTFFKGQLGRASKLSDNIIFRAEGDVFVIDNTAMISSYEVFESSGNVLSNDTPDLNNLSGYMYNLTGVSGGVIYGNTGSYLRKGGIICTGVTNMRISNNIFKDINRNVDVDGAIYDGVYLNSTSSGNIIDGTFVRNAYSTTQCRSVVNDNGTNNNVTNFTGVNVSNQYLLSSSANTSGILDGRIRKRREIYSDTAPTTGAWVRGDIAWNQSVSSGGSMGRVCTVSGTPGTWSTFGTIS